MSRLRQLCPCIIFDSSREALVAGLKATPWLVKPNRHELEIWAGKPLPELKDVIDAAHALRDKGIAHVVISLGQEGALWVNASGARRALPPHCEVVSTVGAGDSMVGGLVYGLLMSQSSEHTLRMATAVSALAVSQPGVGVRDRAELAAMMAKSNSARWYNPLFFQRFQPAISCAQISGFTVSSTIGMPSNRLSFIINSNGALPILP